jgi:very-short-patch-repair endonuclease
VAGLEVDFLWPGHGLVAETDGAATHLTATAFETDRRRDAILQVAGLRVVRLTWRQLDERPHTVAQTLGALLGVPAS